MTKIARNIVYFNPRSPCGERLVKLKRYRGSSFISIHAPRVGSDSIKNDYGVRVYHFNPRSPCGERRGSSPASAGPLVFQSTLPVWGATVARADNVPVY